MLKPTLFAVALVASGTAFASGECPLPRADAAAQTQWQPKDALEKKLTGEGWKVRRVKTDGACYEVYATDAGGKKVEAYFDPKTLAPAKQS